MKTSNQISEQYFSALQRAEIAEIEKLSVRLVLIVYFSALQRAEIAEICRLHQALFVRLDFSALQRAEIAEIVMASGNPNPTNIISVLFNEPKLLKFSMSV